MSLEGDALAAWLLARAGKLTASRMGDAIAMLKSGKPAKSRADLIRDILAERMTGSTVRHYVNDAMQHGLDTQQEAKEVYEATTGKLVGGGFYDFYDHPRIDLFGATPDGLLGPDGLIEIKCPTTGTMVEWKLLGNVVPAEHKPQMLAQLACTGRKWCEFVAYDPRIRDEDSRLLIRRFTPTAEEITAIEDAAAKFLAEVDAAWEILTTAAA